MAKKILWAFVVVVAVLVVIVIVAGVVVYVTVDKKFVESKLSQALNRHVTIESIDVSIFSLFSGIEVKNIAISNYKTPEERAKLLGKPVSPDDTFAQLKAFRFKLKVLPLLKREVEMKELVLVGPQVNLVKYRDGSMNIRDLLPVKGEEAKEKREEEPAKPVSADMMPAAVSIGEIGLKEGTINYYDEKLGHTFQVYGLTFLLHGIEIDPRDLEKRDEIKVTFHTGLKTIGKLKTESIQSFNVILEASGQVIPFDRKTRLLDPEVMMRISFPEGEISGLRVFHAIASIPILGEYLGEYLSFLKGTQSWKASRESKVDLRYKGNRLALKNGRLDLPQSKLAFAGEMNTKSKALEMEVGMAMNRQINEAVKGALAKKIDSIVAKPEVKKYIRTDDVAQGALKPLLNEEGAISFTVKVTGTTEKPVVKVVKPEIKSLSEVAKDAMAAVAKEAAKEAVKGAAKDLLPAGAGEVIKDVGGLLKKK